MSKNVWITGASSGIGKALAIKFANEGWQVAASARRENLLLELNKNYPNIQAFPLDVVQTESINNTFNLILKKMGQIDLCIFSTGTYEPKLEKEINEKQISGNISIDWAFVLRNISKTI